MNARIQIVKYMRIQIFGLSFEIKQVLDRQWYVNVIDEKMYYTRYVLQHNIYRYDNMFRKTTYITGVD